MAAMAKEAKAVAAEAVATAAAMAMAAEGVIWKPSALFLKHICEARVSHVHMAGIGRHAASACAGHARAGSPAVDQSCNTTQGCPATGKCDDTPHGEYRRSSRVAMLQLMSSMSLYHC